MNEQTFSSYMHLCVMKTIITMRMRMRMMMRMVCVVSGIHCNKLANNCWNYAAPLAALISMSHLRRHYILHSTPRACGENAGRPPAGTVEASISHCNTCYATNNANASRRLGCHAFRAYN